MELIWIPIRELNRQAERTNIMGLGSDNMVYQGFYDKNDFDGNDVQTGISTLLPRKPGVVITHWFPTNQIPSAEKYPYEGRYELAVTLGDTTITKQIDLQADISLGDWRALETNGQQEYFSWQLDEFMRENITARWYRDDTDIVN